MAQYDDLNTRQIWIVGILSAVLTGITILAVQVLYYALLTRHGQIVSERSEYSQGNEYIDSQLRQISSYGRDPLTGEIHIPIDKAFQLMLENNGPVAPADKPPAPETPAPETPADGSPANAANENDRS